MRILSESKDIIVTVAAGSGHTDFDLLGVIKVVCFDAPTDAATYDSDITDGDEYGIDGWTSLKGDVTVKVEDICLGKNTLTISNATDGTYNVRLYFYSGI